MNLESLCRAGEYTGAQLGHLGYDCIISNPVQTEVSTHLIPALHGRVLARELPLLQGGHRGRPGTRLHYSRITYCIIPESFQPCLAQVSTGWSTAASSGQTTSMTWRASACGRFRCRRSSTAASSCSRASSTSTAPCSTSQVRTPVQWRQCRRGLTYVSCCREVGCMAAGPGMRTPGAVLDGVGARVLQGRSGCGAVLRGRQTKCGWTVGISGGPASTRNSSAA